MTWLTRLFIRWRDRPDQCAIMQTRPKPVGTYSYAKAKAGVERSRRQSASGKPLPKPRKARPATVTPLRRQA